MVATLQDMPVTQLYLVEPISNTGVGGLVTFYWNENDLGPFKATDNTEGNDTLITEGFICLSALKGTTGLEYAYFTGGTSPYLTNGTRQVTYTMTSRGLPPTNKANPPSAGFSRFYRSHLADAMCVFNETSLTRNAAEVFQAATTDETVTAGEALNASSAALGVSLHTDNKYYKYHSTNYPNFQGVIEQGNNVAADASFTLKNLRGSSTNHTGLTAGSQYFVDDNGVLTTTNSSTTVYLGKARNTTTIDHALQFNASSMSNAEVTTGTDTDPQLVSAAQLKLAAETHGAKTVKSIIPKPADGEGPNYQSIKSLTNNTTAYWGAYDLPFNIDLNVISFNCSSAITASTLDIAMYSEDGQTKYFEHTTASISSGGNKNETLSTEVSIPAGKVIIGIIANDASANVSLRFWDTHAQVAAPSGKYVTEGTTTETAGTLPATINPTTITFAQDSTLIIRLDN